ncbi:hypothetical protein BR93DRAFT_925846 [Coniochaeta sp. PMI_546]|nr:hypothetical protein BR93DRAFT_925846 [Coniochaeta sp. PMI_546]
MIKAHATQYVPFWACRQAVPLCHLRISTPCTILATRDGLAHLHPQRTLASGTWDCIRSACAHGSVPVYVLVQGMPQIEPCKVWTVPSSCNHGSTDINCTRGKHVISIIQIPESPSSKDTCDLFLPRTKVCDVGRQRENVLLLMDELLQQRDVHAETRQALIVSHIAQIFPSGLHHRRLNRYTAISLPK